MVNTKVDTKQTTVRLRPELYLELLKKSQSRKISGEKDYPMNYMVNEAVKQWLDREERNERNNTTNA
jgi:hypothetical protein